MRKAVLSGVLALTLGPAAFLLALGALLNPAAQASCLPTTCCMACTNSSARLP